MLQFPNCKINLGLTIKGKRDDGYHDLESIFYPLPLQDALEIIPSTSLRFESYGIPIPGAEENNIVLKAYHLIKRDYPTIPFVHICLLKKIPTGAGLGGGSADAVVMLKLLNSFFELNINEETMLHYAQELGSDCPFFVANKPSFVQGRGEKITPIILDLSKYQFTVIKPKIHISTPWAFSQVVPNVAPKNLLEIIGQPITTWKNRLINDFEIPIFKQYPRIREIKEYLYSLGAVYVAMSGSGSAVYGIFENNPPENQIREFLADEEIFFC